MVHDEAMIYRLYYECPKSEGDTPLPPRIDDLGPERPFRWTVEKHDKRLWSSLNEVSIVVLY
jgi:hypothetical protein